MTKLQSVISIWLYAIIAAVLALNQAIPYELLSFYDAYKIDYRANSGVSSSMTIAAGCHHVTGSTNPVDVEFDKEAAAAGIIGICNLQEFARHIGDPATFGQNGVYTSDDWRKLDPDVSAIDRDVRRYLRSNKMDRFQIVPTRMLPAPPLPPPNQPIPYRKVLRPVLNVIQKGRQAALAANDIDLDQFVHKYTDHAAAALRVAHQWRSKDNASSFQRDVTNFCVGKGIASEVVPYTATMVGIDGQTPLRDANGNTRTYRAYDWTAITNNIQQNIPSSLAISNELQQMKHWLKKYSKKKSSSGKHAAVIVEMEFDQTILTSPDTKCK